MDVKFVSQSYEPSVSLKDFIDDGARDGSFTSLTVCVAWAKRSGFNIIQTSLNHFKTSGGYVELIVGISEGGATKQGLNLTYSLADSAYVFHDRRGATFHPKIYLFEGADKARLFVGSNNLTAGGAYFNYEAALIANLDKRNKIDLDVLVDVREFLNKIIADTNLCRPIDSNLIAQIVDNPRYRISDEDFTRRRSSASVAIPTEVEDCDSTDINFPLLEELFGRSIHPHTPRPRPVQRTQRPTRAKKAVSVSGRRSGNRNSASNTTLETWTKVLQATDAQQPRQPGSQVTGNLRLSKAGNAIDHKTYFRDVFFFNEHWINADPGDPNYEKCLVEIKVKALGATIGTYPFRIDHKSGRIADQNNVPTVLKWGPLGTYMRANNFQNRALTLTSLADGTYLMEIN